MKKLTLAAFFTLLCTLGFQSNVLSMKTNLDNYDADDSPELVMDLPVDDDDATPTTLPSREQVALDNDDDKQNFQPISASEDERRALELQNELNQEVQPSPTSSSSSSSRYNLRTLTPSLTATSSSSSSSRVSSPKTSEQKFLDRLSDNLNTLMNQKRQTGISSYDANMVLMGRCCNLLERLSDGLVYASADLNLQDQIRQDNKTFFDENKAKLETLAKKLFNLSKAITDPSIILLISEIVVAEGIVPNIPETSSAHQVVIENHRRTASLEASADDHFIPTETLENASLRNNLEVLCTHLQTIHHLADDFLFLPIPHLKESARATIENECEQVMNITSSISTENISQNDQDQIEEEIRRIERTCKNLKPKTLKKCIQDTLNAIKKYFGIATSRSSTPASRKSSPRLSPTPSSSSSSSLNPSPVLNDKDPDAFLISNLTTLSEHYSDPALQEAYAKDLISLCAILIQHLKEKGIANREKNASVISQIRNCIQTIYVDPRLTKSSDLYRAIETVLKKITTTLNSKKRKQRPTNESESNEKENQKPENKKTKLDNEKTTVQQQLAAEEATGLKILIKRQKETTSETEAKNSATSVQPIPTPVQNTEEVTQLAQQLPITLVSVNEQQQRISPVIAAAACTSAQQQELPATRQEIAKLIEDSKEVVALARKYLPPSQLWNTLTQDRKAALQVIIRKTEQCALKLQAPSSSPQLLLHFKTTLSDALKLLRQEVQGTLTQSMNTPSTSSASSSSIAPVPAPPSSSLLHHQIIPSSNTNAPIEQAMDVLALLEKLIKSESQWNKIPAGIRNILNKRKAEIEIFLQNPSVNSSGLSEASLGIIRNIALDGLRQ